MTTRWEVERAVASSTLEPIARLIVLTLLIKVDNETAVIPPEYSPSYSTLEAATGLSRSMLSKHLDRLEDLGWVKRSKPPKNSRHERTRYALAPGANPERERRPSRRWKAGSSSSQEPQTSSSSQEPLVTSTDERAVLPENYSSCSSQELPLVLPKNCSAGGSSSSQELASSRTTTTKSTTKAARKSAPPDDESTREPTTKDRAFGIARGWLDYRAKQNTPVVARKRGVEPLHILANLIEPVLIAGYLDDEVKRALNGIGEGIPSAAQFDRGLAAVRRGTTGARRPGRPDPAALSVNSNWDDATPGIATGRAEQPSDRKAGAA